MPPVPPAATGRAPGRVRAAWGAGLALFCLLLSPLAQAQTQTLRRLSWSFVAPDPSARDGIVAPATRFELPLRWPSEPGSALRTVELRLPFTLDETPPPGRPWALLLRQATEGGQYAVNGHAIGAVADESDSRHVQWRRPTLLSIDPSLLNAGENEVELRLSYGAGSHLLAGAEIGPMDELWNAYAIHLFLAWLWNWIGATLALLAAAFFGAFWLQRREAGTGLVAVAALAWLVRCGSELFEIMPRELQMPVHLAGMSATACFAALLTTLLMRQSGMAQANRRWLLWTFAPLGPMQSTLTGSRADAYLDLSWQPCLLLLVATGLAPGLYRRARHLAAPPALVLLGAVCFVLAGLADTGARAGLSGLAGLHALDFAGAVALLAMAVPQISTLTSTVLEAEAAQAELETRVREREQLLKRNFERLRESERAKVEVQERQRIMQDMHDGLGSQLMSSLMLVERGAVSNEQFAQILRESIDDMRLAIDALSADDSDLAAALGNLRFRMEPRLRAAGIELAWDARRLPEEVGLHPDMVLPVLRIVQEALTNSLKHSRARAVRVVLACEGAGDAQWLDIRITDNGRGISDERGSGRGLLNMRNRAQKIGAQLKIETALNVGTSVHLRVRIDPSTPTVRGGQTVLNTQAVLERVRGP